MKKLFFSITLAIAGVIFAEEAKSDLSDSEKAAKKAAAHQRMLERTGGIIEKKGAGKVAVVNCQKRMPQRVMEERLASFRSLSRISLDIIEADPIPAGDILSKCRQLPTGYAAALYVLDDASLPMSLSAAEEHWAMVNVANLSTDRFGKQFVRGVVMAFGGNVGVGRMTPMSPVSKPSDLDAIAAGGVPMESMGGIMRNLQALGVTRSMKKPYRKACEEGWAPSPTNNYQKAIWDEVHAIPSEPLKIKKQK